MHTDSYGVSKTKAKNICTQDDNSAKTNACITLQAEQKTCSTAQVLQPIKQKKPTDMQQRSRQMLRVR